MDGAKLIERIRLRNILSFGEEGQEIVLEPLNVLIGPNGSGKSNVIHALGLLQAAPTDLAAAIRVGGGVREWLWKGPNHMLVDISDIEVTANEEVLWGTKLLHYSIGFTEDANNQVRIANESLQGSSRDQNLSDLVDYFYHRGERVAIATHAPAKGSTERSRELVEREFSESGGLDRRQSILSQVRDSVQYPELTAFGNNLRELSLYREFNRGRSAPARVPQRADLPDAYLLEDASNLGLVLNLLEVRGKKRRIIEFLQKFYAPTEDFTIRIQGGTVQFYLHERGLNQPISAMRLSDGTLHFLYLLAILLHPDPPPLICIEEPEIGLHPDVIPTVAELLVEASQRTQLIVTTHSDALVSALSATPEAIVVCERDERGTQLRRLEPDRLKEWLERYTPGDLWHMGEIGGTRW